jgi:hypothetical protein
MLNNSTSQGVFLHGKAQKKMQTYEGVSKSFRTGHLERELQMVQLCHWVQLYRYFVSQSSEFYFCKRVFYCRLSPVAFGCTLVSVPSVVFERAFPVFQDRLHLKVRSHFDRLLIL